MMNTDDLRYCLIPSTKVEGSRGSYGEVDCCPYCETHQDHKGVVFFPDERTAVVYGHANGLLSYAVVMMTNPPAAVALSVARHGCTAVYLVRRDGADFSHEVMVFLEE